MKKLTNEEVDKLLKKLENGNHPVRDVLLQIQLGENILVSKHEWNWKSKTPSHICRDLERKTKLRFKCYRLLDKTGWVITRVA